MPRCLYHLHRRSGMPRGLLILLAAVFGGCQGSPESMLTPRAAVSGTAPSDSAPLDSRWKTVTHPREFIFPRDHGSHAPFKIEWWYYTGNVTTAEGRRFGYQLTFFRSGIQPEVDNESRWAVRDLYIAHFAVSDVDRKQFFRFERTNRAGIGWAGAEDVPGRIWNGDWQVRMTHEGDQTRHELAAEKDGVRIHLSLEPEKPVVLHGDHGLSRKGPSPGNASYYYSYTRLATSGRITIGDTSFQVTGESWMDHEFSSSFLEKGQEGWDWFSIQLDDGTEYMVYQIREKGGEAGAFTSGTRVDVDGSARHLPRSAFRIEPQRYWLSPATGARYPVRWRVTIPEESLTLEVSATFETQEMDTRRSTGIIYWEGCVDVRGTRRGIPITGRGYLEMTGYAPSAHRPSH